jgi:hypothetical protein
MEGRRPGGRCLLNRRKASRQVWTHKSYGACLSAPYAASAASRLCFRSTTGFG